MSVRNDAAAAEAARREAARRAAEAARKAAEAKRQAMQRQEAAEARRAALAQQQAKAKQATARTERSQFNAATQGSGPASRLPRTPEDVARAFPQLKDAPKQTLQKVYDAMGALVRGTLPEKLSALATLAKTFPGQTSQVLQQLGVSDARLEKLAAAPKALEALSTLLEPDAKPVEKAQAALQLAQAAGEILSPSELKGFLGHALEGLPAAEKLVAAVAAWANPDASGLDKAEATLELASALKDFTGSAFPQLAPALGRLEGPMRAVSAAVTLLDPGASPQDKALAAAQLAGELPDLKKDVAAFAELLSHAGVKDADALARGAAAGAAVKGLSPELAAKLTPAELSQLEAVATRVGPEQLEAVLKNVSDPSALRALTGQLEKLEPATARRLLSTVAGMDGEVLQRALKDAGTLDSLGKLAGKLDDEGAKVLAKVVREMDGAALGALLRLSDAVPADVLRTGLKTLGPVVDKAGGKVVGQSLKVLDAMLGKMGVQVTADVAGKVFKTLAKAVPVAGAVPNVVDAAFYAKESVELRGLNKDLGYLAQVGAGVNVVDAVAGIALDLTGVGVAADVAVSVLFGAAELALDIGFQAEKAKLLADPKGYEAPGWVRGVNLAYAAAQGPAGMASLAAYYGPEDGAKLVEWGVAAGAKGAVEVARWAGVQSAEVAGNQLKLAGGMMHQLADVLRNPTKYGAAVADAARDTFNAAVEAGGALAAQARETLASVVADAKKLGEKGLQTLEWLARNPGPAARMAVEGIRSLVQSGVNLATDAGKATYRKAVETLESLQAGYAKLTGAAREKAKELVQAVSAGLQGAVDKAVQLGARGAELLAWAATHPGEAGAAATKAIHDALRKGGELARATWDAVGALGAKGATLARDAISGLKSAGAAGVEVLAYVAKNPGAAGQQAVAWAGRALGDLARGTGEAATKAASAVKDFIDARATWAVTLGRDLVRQGSKAMLEVARAWKDELTEGGKAFLDGLKDLGDAGVDALKDLASAGGQLAQAAAERLGTLAKAGVKRAREALGALAAVGGAVGQAAASVAGTLEDWTDGEFTVGGVTVDFNPFW